MTDVKWITAGTSFYFSTGKNWELLTCDFVENIHADHTIVVKQYERTFDFHHLHPVRKFVPVTPLTKLILGDICHVDPRSP